MLVAIVQARVLLSLKSQLRTANAQIDRLQQSNAMMSLRVLPLEARDASYGTAKVIVAWDPYQSRGVVSAQGLPSPAAGTNYQLWVLDPAAQTPVNAGMIRTESVSTPFSVPATSTISPGFAITLEPAQGSPEPTSSILFAVPPGQ